MHPRPLLPDDRASVRVTLALPLARRLGLPSLSLVLSLVLATGCSSGGVNPSSGNGGGGATAQGTGGFLSPGTGGALAATGGATGSGGAKAPGSGGVSATGGGAPGSGTGGAAGGGGAGNGNAGGVGGPGAGGAASRVTPFLTEDFESGTVGQPPAGWDNFISYIKNGPNPNGDTLALVDNKQAHGGKSSVHFHGGGNPAMITRPLPAGTNKLYVRAYVYQTRQLGMNPGANHETLIGIRKTSGNANDEVRFGEIKGVIGTNEVPTDNIAPKMAEWGMGPVVAPNRWACIEVAFIGDQPQHVLQAWADGVLVHSITAPDQWQNGVMPMTWLAGKFNEVILGWQSFSNATNDVWVDDLVLSTGPIGCT